MPDYPPGKDYKGFEEAIDNTLYGDLNEGLKAKLKQMKRIVEKKLLEDYLDWLAENNIIGKGSELHKERYTDRFLDERSKKNE